MSDSAIDNLLAASRYARKRYPRRPAGESYVRPRRILRGRIKFGWCWSVVAGNGDKVARGKAWHRTDARAAAYLALEAHRATLDAVTWQADAEWLERQSHRGRGYLGYGHPVNRKFEPRKWGWE